MSDSTYIIAGGKAGSDRLMILADATWPTTKPFLAEAGVGPGARVLDLACGNGEIGRRYGSELMANSGRIVAVDKDDVAIETARGHLAGIPTAETRQADVVKDDIGEPGTMDFVYLRFILSHVTDPVGLLRKAKACLRKGGKILVEDVDFDGHVSYPENPSFGRYVRLYKDLGKAQNVDSTIGRKLVHHIKEAGLQPVLLRGNCPAFYDGPGKQMALITLKLISPGLLASGHADTATLDAITADLEAYTADPHTVMSLPHIFQIAATVA